MVSNLIVIFMWPVKHVTFCYPACNVIVVWFDVQMNKLWGQLMETLRDSSETDATRTSIQLLMCHTGLQLFYDSPNGIELLKVKQWSDQAYENQPCEDIKLPIF